MSALTAASIVGIQFSVLSPEEIRKASVAQIVNKDTYSDNRPIVGGLFDPRMGVLEQGLICPTDGLNYIQTPGYFGHLELARPVFYIQHLTTVQKLLKCVCLRCGKLLLSKIKHKHVLEQSNAQRWLYVSEACKTLTRCGGNATDDGCGSLQPTKITKDGIATLIAEYKVAGDKDGKTVVITPELAIRIFKRISDDDVSFMGFSPVWSRPEWFVCQVLAVPPPAVRPSVKHDANQRSEDDLTSILAHIFKTNATLNEKIKSNADEKTIQEWSMVLQYHVACLVDNKIQGAAPLAQRSGRPLKSIKDRLVGKTGRMRGNLMAKRVDFSARSVITADPNISIRELGIPLKIAKNLTTPVVVNARNKAFLSQLVRNGPDVWPGAKILERANGDSITLRYLDRKSIVLHPGDIVHRHMMNGDPCLFNRQPTLHRMSMMCHLARIMHQGNTFRMNVADTKPYNADFDGDEMNLHMPQNPESMAELRQLAAVPFQIISPANNAPIIGIYQDSMLGAFRFTREWMTFSPLQAMNLLMMCHTISPTLFSPENARVSNFQILTQILPPLSMHTKNKLFASDKESMATSNNVLEIVNGVYVRGQMDKGILGSSSKGIIHRICNDFGNMASAQFIDDFQHIITEYMKHSAFSVGIGDIVVGESVNASVIRLLTEKKHDVQQLLRQVQLGLFENTSGKSNEEEIETKINNILGKAQAEAGRAALNSLTKENRFVCMFNAGSKGSEINIQQMTACLGQQNVDGKRIPCGFDARTLPHFCKYDDSAVARGFVESSYIDGLSPEEFYFHAMGGRIGLIDTAVKTSKTGYIQRRLIKAMEDLSVRYDQTVRNNKNVIVQFSYGDDSIDTIKVETQDIGLAEMSVQDIYGHFAIPTEEWKRFSMLFEKDAFGRMMRQKDQWTQRCQQTLDFMRDVTPLLVKHVFNDRAERTVRSPVAFASIIQNVLGQLHITSNAIVDLTPLEAFRMLDDAFALLESIRLSPPTLMFRMLFYYHLSPKQLLFVKRMGRAALELTLDKVVLHYKQALVAPGEMVGMIAAQSIGEPTTQMTLNTFHFAGVASKSNVTRGVPRIEELLSLISKIHNPSLTVFLKPEDEQDKDKANAIQYMLEHTKLEDIVRSVDICFDPDNLQTLIREDRDTMEQYKEFETMVDDCDGISKSTWNTAQTTTPSKWILRMEMDPEAMFERNITMDDVHFALVNAHQGKIQCVYTDYNADTLVFRIRINEKMLGKPAKASLDQSDKIYVFKNFQDQLLQNIVLRGIKHISKVMLRKMKDALRVVNGAYQKQDIWVLDTIGTNLLHALGLDYIDASRTVSNDILEVHNILGMEAARQCIYNELIEVLEFDGSYVNAHHVGLLCDRMTYSHDLISIFRHDINNDDVGPIAKASFEETPKQFYKAARHAELDTMTGISANVMCGQEGMFGTAAFQIFLNMPEMMQLKSKTTYTAPVSSRDIISNSLFGQLEADTQAGCSLDTLRIHTNAAHLKEGDHRYDTSYDPFA